MINCFKYLFIVLGVCNGCFSNGTRKESDYSEDKYVGNPDDFAKIERPCPVYDLNCIRQFFAEHSHCTIVNGPMPDNVPRSQYTIYYSRVNVTVTNTNLINFGLNSSRVEEFYVNRATNNVVFAVNIRNFGFFTPSSYFRFYRRGREPITSVTFAGVTYASATFTAIIPYIDDLQLDKAEVTAYVDDAFPRFVIGPDVVNSVDPTIVQSIAEYYDDIPTDLQEDMLTSSLFYPITYIQYNICDFGLRYI